MGGEERQGKSCTVGDTLESRVTEVQTAETHCAEWLDYRGQGLQNITFPSIHISHHLESLYSTLDTRVTCSSLLAYNAGSHFNGNKMNLNQLLNNSAQVGIPNFNIRQTEFIT